ncbi:MAG: hypothetical protein R3C56_05095 [Pirellulaceae bacterium]
MISQRGAMLTSSRYADHLGELPLARDQSGSLEANPNNQPIMVRDPGINLLGGSRPSQGSATWLPTLLARHVSSR